MARGPSPRPATEPLSPGLRWRCRGASGGPWGAARRGRAHAAHVPPSGRESGRAWPSADARRPGRTRHETLHERAPPTVPPPPRSGHSGFTRALYNQPGGPDVCMGLRAGAHTRGERGGGGEEAGDMRGARRGHRAAAGHTPAARSGGAGPGAWGAGRQQQPARPRPRPRPCSRPLPLHAAPARARARPPAAPRCRGRLLVVVLVEVAPAHAVLGGEVVRAHGAAAAVGVQLGRDLGGVCGGGCVWGGLRGRAERAGPPAPGSSAHAAWAAARAGGRGRGRGRALFFSRPCSTGV